MRCRRPVVAARPRSGGSRLLLQAARSLVGALCSFLRGGGSDFSAARGLLGSCSRGVLLGRSGRDRRSARRHRDGGGESDDVLRVFAGHPECRDGYFFIERKRIASAF